MRQEEVDNKGPVGLTCFTFLQLSPELSFSVSPLWVQLLVLALLLTTRVTFISSRYLFLQLKKEYYKSTSPFRMHLSFIFKYFKTHVYPSGV